MKTLPLVISGILAVVVAILFFQVNSLKQQLVQSVGGQGNDSTKITTVNAANLPGMPDTKIAYINSDTVQERYEFISDLLKDINRQRIALESSYESMMTKAQADYQALQESAEKGILPQSELEKRAADIERQRREIANKQLQMDELAAKTQVKNEELHDKVEEFLKRFNNGKYDYILSYSKSLPGILLTNPKLDITNQVLEGLNKEYKEEKAAKADKKK